MTVPILDVGLGTPWEQGRALWVFGYGSLMYRVDFPTEAQVFGYIHGRKRAFLQKSHYHRGTPSNPGRVCTLLPSTDSRVGVLGRSLQSPIGEEHEVKALLDYREKDGYSIEFVGVYTKQGVLSDVMVYVGVSSNPSFAGESSIEETAQVIARAEGPSGSSCEYLYKLCNTLRQLCHEGVVVDEYLLELKQRVREIERVS